MSVLSRQSECFQAEMLNGCNEELWTWHALFSRLLERLLAGTTLGRDQRICLTKLKLKKTDMFFTELNIWNYMLRLVSNLFRCVTPATFLDTLPLGA